MRKGLLGVAFALVAVGATGCQGAQEGGDGSGQGVVLVDKEARAAGFAVEIAGKRLATVLPIAIDDDDDVALVGPTGRATLSGAEGELLHVEGRQGKLESLGIGQDIEADRVLVEGTEEAARALAEMLAGEVTAADDGWQIKANDALHAAAGLPAPDGLIALSPAAVSAEDGTVERVGRAVEAFGGMKDRAGRVGKAADFDHVLAKMQDYGLPTAVECADPIVGTWMSQDYDERFTDWYVFTMHVKRVQGTTDVVGEIEAHSWNGGPLDTAPGANACDGNGGHWVVKMTATGTYQGGELHFGGTAWHLDKTICGRAPQPWEYNLDQFSGTIDKSGFKALNNDGGRMIDQPTPFRRVSCQ
jgi:hypothetical protein